MTIENFVCPHCGGGIQIKSRVFKGDGKEKTVRRRVIEILRYIETEAINESVFVKSVATTIGCEHSEVDSVLSGLLREGMIFRPKKGVIELLK